LIGAPKSANGSEGAAPGGDLGAAGALAGAALAVVVGGFARLLVFHQRRLRAGVPEQFGVDCPSTIFDDWLRLVAITDRHPAGR
jgi:hypothetical protein